MLASEELMNIKKMLVGGNAAWLAVFTEKYSWAQEGISGSHRGCEPGQINGSYHGGRRVKKHTPVYRILTPLPPLRQGITWNLRRFLAQDRGRHGKNDSSQPFGMTIAVFLSRQGLCVDIGRR